MTQAPDTVVSDLDPRYKVAPGEFILNERYTSIRRCQYYTIYCNF